MFGGKFTKIIIPAEERGNRISVLSVWPESLCDVWMKKNRFLKHQTIINSLLPTGSKALFVFLKLLPPTKRNMWWMEHPNKYIFTDCKCYVKIKIVPSSVFVIAVNTLLPKDADGFHLLILTGRQL